MTAVYLSRISSNVRLSLAAEGRPLNEKAKSQNEPKQQEISCKSLHKSAPNRLHNQATVPCH